MMQAVEARSKAYAPYSKFTVGAAILLDNGIVVQGSNQENAAYPSGLCAERVAIYYAGATYPNAKNGVSEYEIDSILKLTEVDRVRGEYRYGEEYGQYLYRSEFVVVEESTEFTKSDFPTER